MVDRLAPVGGLRRRLLGESVFGAALVEARRPRGRGMGDRRRGCEAATTMEVSDRFERSAPSARSQVVVPEEGAGLAGRLDHLLLALTCRLVLAAGVVGSGHSSAHDARRAAERKGFTSTPISAMIASAHLVLTP